MKRLITQYHYRYLNNLVYMLQVSEYEVQQYLRWWWRARNFARIQVRGQLKWTRKTRFLSLTLHVMWLTGMLVIAGLLYLWTLYPDGYYHWIALTIFLLLPFLLAHLILVPLWLGQRLIQQPKEKQMLKRAARRLAEHDGMRIAVLGSYGKTTMKEVLKTILQEGQKVAATPGNINRPIGLGRFITSLEGHEQILIFEFGEFRVGDVKKMAELVKPSFAFITGLNEAHLDTFKTIEHTRQTISEIFDFVPEENIYLNGESYKLKINRPKSVVYSRAHVGDWQISDPQSDLDGTRFVMTKGEEIIKANSRLLGVHQIGPLAAAAAFAHAHGLSIPQIEAGLAATKPFDHRLQPLPRQDGVVVIDDTYNGNPDGALAGIEFLANISAPRKIYVTPGFVEMGPLSKKVHIELGERLAAFDVVVLIKNSVTPQIATGLESGGFQGELIWFKDALKAYKSLDSIVKKGDVVILQNDWPDQYA